MSLPVTVAMPPSLEKVHPLPVGMTVAGCRCPPIAARLEALDDLQEAAMGRFNATKPPIKDMPIRNLSDLMLH